MEAFYYFLGDSRILDRKHLYELWQKISQSKISLKFWRCLFYNFGKYDSNTFKEGDFYRFLKNGFAPSTECIYIAVFVNNQVFATMRLRGEGAF